MVSRRSVLLGMAAATAASFGRFEDLEAAPSQPTTPLNFTMPPNACDCHTHIVGDTKRFPMTPGRAYTPEGASLEELVSFHKGVHIDRTILVNSNVYGTDMSIAIEALQKLGPQARGVATLEDSVTDAQIDALHKAGFRGTRYNLFPTAESDAAVARQRLQTMGKKLDGRGWSIDVQTRLPMTEELFDAYMAVPVPLVFTHFGGAQASAGLAQPGFPALLRLVSAGKAYVKLSAVYRAGKQAPAYTDAGLLATALANANPDRVIYGSDWPHPLGVPPPGGTKFDIAPFLQVDDGLVVNQYAVWFPDAGLRKKIFVDNPARLYGF